MPPTPSPVPACPACTQPYTATSCQPDDDLHRYGDEAIWASIGHTPPPRCRDCGVALGGHHHAACCIAECARCGAQALTHDDDEFADRLVAEVVDLNTVRQDVTRTPRGVGRGSLSGCPGPGGGSGSMVRGPETRGGVGP
jgi:hypothetical protein